GPDLTAEGLARAFAVTELRPARAPARPESARPAPRPVRGTRIADVLHTALPGLDLLVRRKSGVPLATLGLYAPRTHFDPPAQAGLGALLTRSAIRGAGGLDAGALAYAFERLGGSLGPSAAVDWLGFGTSVLVEHLAEAAALLDLVYRSPDLHQDAVAAERGLMIAEAEQVTDDMFRYPFQLAFSAAFGAEGYGLPVGGLPHTLPACTAADVRAWHRHALLEARPVLVAVGAFDPEGATEALAGVLGDRGVPATDTEAAGAAGWTAGADGEPPMRVVPRTKAQAAIAMAFPGPGRRDPDRTAASVWAAVASGLGGRLFEALRDRRSLAYTVVASSWQKARGGSLLTYIATSPEREEEAREQMLLELERFAREPVSEEELGQAINYLAGQAEVARQSGGAVAAEILEAWLAGAGLEELENPAARYRLVTAEAVRRVAETYLVPSQRAEGVVRGTGTAAAPVAALQG
ncbi:MAG TPA: pitrilysin family protein, partial [Gemmatimonadales bacterium]|nr:pitrilysin family protein [Gemmatimonadales bacterium]